MKIRTTLLTLAFAACPSIAMAVPISIDVGLSNTLNQGVDSSTFDGSGDTSIDFSSTAAFAANNCSDILFCGNPVVVDTNLMSGVQWEANWSNNDLIYRTDTSVIWSVIENPTGSYTIQTWGTYSTITNGGYDPTYGFLTFTFQERCVQYGNDCYYSVSASGGTGDRVSVPEPATLSLLGAGLLGMGLFGRRRRLS